jgi:toxin ParE1/3/4
MKLILSRRARQDMDAISAYTLENWGKTQLLDYVGGLLDSFDKIAENPNIGGKVQTAPPQFLRYSYRAHFIFYTCRDDDLHIIRILHQNMDIARHLGQ